MLDEINIIILIVFAIITAIAPLFLLGRIYLKNEKIKFFSAAIISLALSSGSSFLLFRSDISIEISLILGVFQFLFLNSFLFLFEIKYDLSNKVNEIFQSKTTNDDIIMRLAEYNLLRDTFFDHIQKDLEFDKNIKCEMDSIKSFHLYLSNLKLKNYFREFFNYDSEHSVIRNIPSGYFKEKIWKKFVTESNHYYSVQIMSYENTESKIYLDDENRQDKEINTLSDILKSPNSYNNDMRKIFIIDNVFFDDHTKKLKAEDKIKGRGMKEYLQKLKIYFKKWNDELKSQKDKFPIKIIVKNKAIGRMPDDIGIFGDVYGVQLEYKDSKEKFIKDNLSYEFHFNKSETERQIQHFNEYFNNENAVSLYSLFE